MQLVNAVKNLGLNDKQAQIYLALVQLGQTTGYAIAEAVNIKKPTVYVVLEDLRLKGLVRKIPNAKKQLFEAKPPDELLMQAQEGLDQVKSVLPQLLALAKSDNRPKTYLFEGIKGIEQALHFNLEKIAAKEVVGFYAQASGIPRALISIFTDYNNKMKKLAIKSRGIVPDHPSLKFYRETDKQYKREMRVVSSDLLSSSNVVEIGEDFVKIISFHDLHAVIIESKSIAKTFRQIFEMAWGRIGIVTGTRF
jgi:HTH-type transcriptional regulator, sugar sensing transcriptional regulator